ncbi:MAG: PDZ domain-containing protein [Steroidobacteraceae bacterium]
MTDHTFRRPPARVRRALTALAVVGWLACAGPGPASAQAATPPPPPDAPARGAILGVNVGGEGNESRAEGVELMSVSPSGPAAAAGLQKGDVLLAVDGAPLRRTAQRSAANQLVEHLRGLQPGAVVKLDYFRDGRRQSAAVKTVAAEPALVRLMRGHLPLLDGVELPAEFGDFMGGAGRGARSLQLVPMTPKLGQYFGTAQGLLVVRAPPLPESKLEEGDVILTIGGRTPDDVRHAYRILGSYQPTEAV